MNKKMSKRQRDIKSKLMGAVCMLLVSSIMMVSTTYAWFTLSTAPEVTGITTAVGANGNLEMALLPVNGLNLTQDNDYGITSGTSDSMATQAATLANVTWGNLVDLGATVNGVNAYGLDDITLYPAAANYLDEAKTKLNTDLFLQTPVYGADGRVSELQTGTVNGVYNNGAFAQSVGEVSNPAGVRVVGNVSGMSDQQIAFRNAISQASSAATDAGQLAGASLKDNGEGLGAIVVEYAANGNNASFGDDDVAVLQAMVSALNAADGPLAKIEKSIRYFAYASEIAANTNYLDKQEEILSTTDLDDLVDSLTSAPAIVSTMITKLNETVSNVEEAADALDSLSGGSYSWTTIKTPLTYLVNTEQAKLNGSAISGLDKDAVAQSYFDKGSLTLTLPSGSGVYADIADHVGAYSTTIGIPGNSLGINVTVPCTMEAVCTMENGTYQSQARTYFAGVTIDDAAEGTEAISDYYGYIIDLAFKTNASNSYLKLQTDAVNRIYTDGTENEESMGSGSTMTFTSSDATFMDDQVVALMQNIKLVFFDPEDGLIYGYGKLDTDSATYGNGVTMKIEMENVDADAEEDEIMDLEQNKAHRLSVLVYLDGENVKNADVAFNKDTSMSGSINLQFASSAELVPMAYSDLASLDGSDSGNDEDDNVIPDDTEVLSGISVTETYTATAVYSESLGTIVAQIKDADGGSVTSGTVTINGGEATYSATAGGWVVSNVDAKPESVTITVTASTDAT